LVVDAQTRRMVWGEGIKRGTVFLQDEKKAGQGRQNRKKCGRGTREEPPRLNIMADHQVGESGQIRSNPAELKRQGTRELEKVGSSLPIFKHKRKPHQWGRLHLQIKALLNVRQTSNEVGGVYCRERVTTGR